MTFSLKSRKGKRIVVFLGVLMLLAAYFLRVFPYFTDTVIPLGYDPGLYKAMFEAYRDVLPQIDMAGMEEWIRSNPIGLFLFTNVLYLFSYSSSFLLTYFFAFLSVLVGVFVYLVAAHRFPKYKGLVALVTFALFLVSITQYQVFWWGYYKNVLGIIMLLASVLLLQRKSWLSVLALGFLMIVHRPTALFAGGLILVYVLVNFLEVFWHSTKKKGGIKDITAFIKNSLEIKAGALALLVLLLFYANNLQEDIFPMLRKVTTSFGLGSKSGTFFTIKEYLWHSIWYWPLAIYGFVVSVRKRQFAYIEAGFVFGMIWVFFHMFFYNRMIIQLDVFMVLMAVVGATSLFMSVKKEHLVALVQLVILLFLFAGWRTVSYVMKEAHPLIEREEFEYIQEIGDLVEPDAVVVSTYKSYSSWLRGYSGREVIAPGLFNLNRDGRDNWIKLWWRGDGKSKEEMLKKYNDLGRPIYIYEGVRQPQYSFKNSDCFEYIYNGRYKFIKYICRE